MNKIKALEKLRKWASQHKGWSLYDIEINEIADEIEREIAGQFIELPVDANGAPIRVGDYLQLGETRGKVVALRFGRCNDLWGEWKCESDGLWYSTLLAHHSKPRTLEDVLRDVWKEALDYAKSGIWRNPDEVFAERADEIRAIFGEIGND